MPYEAQRVNVPGGWIYYGGPLSIPVLVSDPARWSLTEANGAVYAQLSTINHKVDVLMATVADVQAALALNESRENTIIGLLTTEAQTLKDTQAQLAAAIAAGADPAALQAVVDKMTADSANMDAAIASVTPPPPADTTPPPADTTPVTAAPTP